MATDRSHKGNAARTLALISTLLWSSCQQASSEGEPSHQMPGAVTAGNAAAQPSANTTTAQNTTPGKAGASGMAVAPANVGNPRNAASTAAGSGSSTPTKAGGASGAAAASGAPAAMSGSSGSAAGAANPAQAGSGGTSSPSTTGEAGAPATAAGSTLPAVTDFKAMGPFTPKREAGPSGYVLFYPQDLGKDGIKHPIFSWGPGAAETASDFGVMLNHIASHGFAIIAFDATPQGQELVTGIDWMLAENMRADSVFYQKLDPSKISAGGHSAGSLATFVIGADKRLVTTLHISGGTFDPHTDIMNLHAPALFVCGEPGGDGLLMGDVANPNCEIDFNNAMVPVFYGITKGAAHMTPTDIGDAMLRTHQLGAMVGWLRWQLAGDANAKTMFVGDKCSLCSDAAWSTAKSKNLN